MLSVKCWAGGWHVPHLPLPRDLFSARLGCRQNADCVAPHNLPIIVELSHEALVLRVEIRFSEIAAGDVARILWRRRVRWPDVSEGTLRIVPGTTESPQRGIPRTSGSRASRGWGRRWPAWWNGSSRGLREAVNFSAERAGLGGDAKGPPCTDSAQNPAHRRKRRYGAGSCHALNELILRVLMVRPERFELPTFWFVARRSIQLSYGRTNGVTRFRIPRLARFWGRFGG